MESMESMEPLEPRGDVQTTVNEGRPWTVGAFALAVAAFFIAPILIGPVGAFVGWTGYRKGDPLGIWAMWTSIAVTALGVVAAVVLVSNNAA